MAEGPGVGAARARSRGLPDSRKYRSIEPRGTAHGLRYGPSGKVRLDDPEVAPLRVEEESPRPRPPRREGTSSSGRSRRRARGRSRPSRTRRPSRGARSRRGPRGSRRRRAPAPRPAGAHAKNGVSPGAVGRVRIARERRARAARTRGRRPRGRARPRRARAGRRRRTRPRRLRPPARRISATVSTTDACAGVPGAVRHGARAPRSARRCGRRSTSAATRVERSACGERPHPAAATARTSAAAAPRRLQFLPGPRDAGGRLRAVAARRSHSPGDEIVARTREGAR